MLFRSCVGCVWWGGDNCVWVLSSESVTVNPGYDDNLNGAAGVLSVSAGDLEARRRYDKIRSKTTAMASPPSDEIRVSLIVGGRQRLKSFGKNNAKLAGHAAHDSGGINVVSAQVKVTHPISPDVSPI